MLKKTNTPAEHKAPKLQNSLLHKAKLRPSSKCKVDYKVNYNGKLGMVLLSLLHRPEKSGWQLPAPGGTGVLLLVKTCMSYKRKELLFFFSGLPLLIKWKSPISFLLHSYWSLRAVSQVDPGGFKTATQSCMLKTAEKALAASNL